MIELANRYQLRNRYLFKGRLVMQTALHIGGGKVTLSPSNSPVVLTPTGMPFIPGSSFKGALRSTVEKLVPMLPEYAGLSSCSLIDVDEDTLKKMNQAEKDRLCPTIRQRYLNLKRRDNADRAEQILEKALDALCDTCRLFGSPFAASHVNINDLYMPVDSMSDIVQIRDGVAIDRDSERAKDGRKYDFEVVPASTAFNLEITLENATLQDLQLLCVGLSEYVHGFGIVGGKRSRGLGASRLEHLTVSSLELDVAEPERSERLRNYLLKRQFSAEESGSAFLDRYISSLFD